MRVTRLEYLNRLNEKEELKTKAITMYEMCEAIGGDMKIARQKVAPVKREIEAIQVFLSQAELPDTKVTSF